NEGITLTTMEALSAGIPVISTNVGSQYTLIPSQGLTRRSTRQFVRDAARSLEHIREEESERQILWEVEYSRLKEFSNLQTANTFVSNLLKEWKNK
ncbi:MAG: glycosyltransferase family 1 protein, partial [Alloscardovia omnicolens]|nr:glycosyltransferase family 1 protein [Alloscardovia omnicolens]